MSVEKHSRTGLRRASQTESATRSRFFEVSLTSLSRHLMLRALILPAESIPNAARPGWRAAGFSHAASAAN